MVSCSCLYAADEEFPSTSWCIYGLSWIFFITNHLKMATNRGRNISCKKCTIKRAPTFVAYGGFYIYWQILAILLTHISLEPYAHSAEPSWEALFKMSALYRTQTQSYVTSWPRGADAQRVMRTASSIYALHRALLGQSRWCGVIQQAQQLRHTYKILVA
jgi:hypothetical protein